MGFGPFLIGLQVTLHLDNLQCKQQDLQLERGGQTKTEWAVAPQITEWSVAVSLNFRIPKHYSVSLGMGWHGSVFLVVWGVHD